MLTIKIVDDTDMFNNRFTKVMVRPDYAANDGDLLRTMNFVYDKHNKSFVRTFTSKPEIRSVVKLLTSKYKFYTLEHSKVIKRMHSKSVKKMMKVKGV